MAERHATHEAETERRAGKSSFPELKRLRGHWLGLAASAALLASACGNPGTRDPAASSSGRSTDTRAPASTSGATGTDPTGSALTNPTFWQNVAPLFNDKCVGCHQSGGIAPFPLDDYADSSLRANQIASLTAGRVMPPYLMQTGGECGSFDESQALTDAQIEMIGNWSKAGAPEGTPVSLTPPPLPTLGDAKEWTTPNFTPQIQGGDLTQFDEYRCFQIDLGLSEDSWVTGWEVVPGNSQMIHHVLGYLFDPGATAKTGGTNADVVQALDAQTPDRDGWPCYAGAGDGVALESVPVSWAPGTGAVIYPGGLGVRAQQGRKMIVQVHYNLANPDLRGQSDQTTIRLKLAQQVTRQAVFLLEDDLLASLDDPNPTTLPPGQALAPYTWTKSLARMLGIPIPIPLDLVSVWAHMHQRGRKWTLELGSGSDYSCIGHIDRWDFNWQRLYQYSRPLTVPSNASFRLTCEYDTSADTEPVLPGWGTQNEMCLAGLMLALPPGIVY
jgi:hypothetical protein